MNKNFFLDSSLSDLFKYIYNFHIRNHVGIIVINKHNNTSSKKPFFCFTTIFPKWLIKYKS